MTEGHLTSGQFIRALDDELTPTEATAVELHLDYCDACRLKLRELGALSASVDEVLLSSMPLGPISPGYRATLAEGLYAQEKKEPGKSAAFWSSGLTAAALAAGLALVLLVPALTRKQPITGAVSNSSTLQVDGETFIALPYSNREVSPVAPRIVEMQVPVSSLLDAGIVFEPISSAAADPDRSVRADVLLGADGEPLGVHVLSQ
jgi:anti-sigma factor RsiW